MNNKITITASDGKVFTGTIDNYVDLLKQIKEYEDKLELEKREREERLRKLEEERKAKKKAEEKAFNVVKDTVDLLNKAIEDYKKINNDLYITIVNGKVKVDRSADYVKSLDLTDLINMFF